VPIRSGRVLIRPAQSLAVRGFLLSANSVILRAASRPPDARLGAWGSSTRRRGPPRRLLDFRLLGRVQRSSGRDVVPLGCDQPGDDHEENETQADIQDPDEGPELVPPVAGLSRLVMLTPSICGRPRRDEVGPTLQVLADGLLVLQRGL